MSYSCRCKAKNCNSWFLSKTGLRNHEEICSILNQYKCDSKYCFQGFETKEELENHKSLYIKKCHRCDAQIRLKNHRIDYTNIKKYVCHHSNGEQKCEKCIVCNIYTKKYNEHQHVVECEFCKKNFVQSPLHPNHDCVKCQGCQKYFSQEEMINHNCDFKCKYCNLSIRRKSDHEMCWNNHNGKKHLVDQIINMKHNVNNLQNEMNCIKEMITETHNMLKYRSEEHNV